MARGNGLTASRTRSMATSISNPRLAAARSAAVLAAAFSDRRLVLNRGQSFQIDAADDALDVGFFDGQVVQWIARGNFGDQFGGGGFEAIELQPAAWAVSANLACTADLQSGGVRK